MSSIGPSLSLTGRACSTRPNGSLRGRLRRWFAALVLTAAIATVLFGPGRAFAALNFASAVNYRTGGATTNSVAIGDLNGDGKRDLAVANGAGVSVLLGTGSGSFRGATNFAGEPGANSVAIGDLNGDGKPDLAVANSDSNDVSVLLGTGSGSFGAATSVGYYNSSQPNSVAIGDLNGDGRQDLAAANNFTNDVSVLLGTGSGSFGALATFGADVGPDSVAIGDLNGDGRKDLVVANNQPNQSAGTVSVLLGTGSGSFAAATNFAAGRQPQQVVIGDLNRDGNQDLVVPNGGSRNVSVLLGTGSGSFRAATNFVTDAGPDSYTPRSAAIGDLNGDGRQDLAVANDFKNDVSVLVGTGSGSFGAPTSFGVHLGPLSVAIGDLNGDGRPDLVAANDESNDVSVLLNVAPPVLGRRVNVQAVSGRVFVRLPGRGFVRLSAGLQIPVGSQLDTRHGTVRLTSAANARGAVQSGDFSAGVFQVLQSRRLHGLTDLNLAGGSFGACTAHAGQVAVASSRVVRRLRGSARGRYRTRGRYSAATVRGTIWDTVDRCDGTLTRVTRGIVVVRDFRKRRNITVRAGKSYFARAP
jgi:hypothetical protein